MIIEVVGKEIEKIKGDFESYLNGLNMVGEISYSQYSKLYDEGTKQIQRAYELGRAELEKENAELKCGCGMCYRKDKEQLTKAKELLKKYVIWCGTATPIKSPLQIEVEQFLKETGK